MVALEDIVYKLLAESIPIKNNLANYKKQPAIFYQQAPPDADKGWNNSIQYPRIDYNIDMRTNSERNCAGTMQISVWCEESGIPPEEIEPLVRDCLKDVFIQADDSSPYSLAWYKTEAYLVPDKTTSVNTKIIGLDLIYDMLEFPCWLTCDPDPIQALNHYIKGLYKEVCLIGHDTLTRTFRASKQVPAIYGRLLKINMDRESNTVAWMRGQIAVHVFAPTQEIRLQWISSIVTTISLSGEIIMLDNSPMRIKSIQVNYTADYLAEGQIMLEVSFGLLRYQTLKNRIMDIRIIKS